MTRHEAERMLDRVLTDVTAALGFKRLKRLEYVCALDGAEGTLSFPLRMDPRGYAAVSCFVGVRIECLAQWLDEERSERRTAVAMPIHLLREDKDYTEWKFSNAFDVEGLRDDVLGELADVALPYIEHYAKLSNLRKAAESSDPKDWRYVCIQADRRVTVLAAIQFFEGDKAGALKTLDDALAERKTARPVKRLEFENLRKRLVEAG